ncbi:hypothetical protein ACSBR1_023709 [Camellia fascicularis]
MIRLQIMNMRSDRRLLSSKWNKVLCPRMDSVLEKAFLDERTWNVSLSSDNVFEVHCFPSVMVDLLLRTCSCRKWKINGYPCQHAVAAIFRSGKNLNSFVEPFFMLICIVKRTHFRLAQFQLLKNLCVALMML